MFKEKNIFNEKKNDLQQKNVFDKNMLIKVFLDNTFLATYKCLFRKCPL